MHYQTAPSRHVTRINRVMLINLGCLALHLLLYSPIPGALLAKHNPFGELIVAMAVAAIVGVWLCLDYMLPVYVEAKVTRDRMTSRPTGMLMALNLMAVTAGGYWAIGNIG